MRRHVNLIIAVLVCGAILGVSGLFSGPGVFAAHKLTVTGAGSCPAGGCLDAQFPTVSSGFAPTGEKPQSKLWFNDGLWWADMLYSDSHHYIFYLSGQTWIKTSTMLDDRAGTQSDCLWDGTHLYVASGAGQVPTGSDLDAKLYRYSYNSANPPDTAYTLDIGFPVTIRVAGAETIV